MEAGPVASPLAYEEGGDGQSRLESVGRGVAGLDPLHDRAARTRRSRVDTGSFPRHRPGFSHGGGLGPVRAGQTRTYGGGLRPTDAIGTESRGYSRCVRLGRDGGQGTDSGKASEG